MCYLLLQHCKKCSLNVPGDPIDNKYVVLKDSEISPLAGEGLKAKVNIPKGTIFCHMSGYILTKSQYLEAQKKLANRLEKIVLILNSGSIYYKRLLKFEHTARTKKIDSGVDPTKLYFFTEI